MDHVATTTGACEHCISRLLYDIGKARNRFGLEATIAMSWSCGPCSHQGLMIKLKHLITYAWKENHWVFHLLVLSLTIYPSQSLPHSLSHSITRSPTHSLLQLPTEAVSSSPLVDSRHAGTKMAGGEKDAGIVMHPGTCKCTHARMHEPVNATMTNSANTCNRSNVIEQRIRRFSPSNLNRSNIDGIGCSHLVFV